MTKEDKKLQLEGLKANLANTERELKTFETALADNNDKLRLLEEQKEIREAIHALSQANFGMVQKKWLWDELPEHNDLLKRLSNNEFQLQMYHLLGSINQVKSNIDGLTEQVASQLGAKKILDEQIAELEK